MNTSDQWPPPSGGQNWPGPAPALTAVSPASGSTVGGTQVTLTGTGFTGATAVRFGSASATSFSTVSDTQITAVTPPGTGVVQVTVTTPAGTSSNFVAFTYREIFSPTLSSATPASGSPAGGTQVTLTGSGFTGATAVRFGSVSATSFSIVSDTRISTVAPAGSGTVQITVTGPGGTSNGVPYSYAIAPVVSGLSPSQGPLSGGNTVNVSGTGFTGVTAVRFGSTPAVSFTVVSPTRLTAVAPAGTAGPVGVTVTTSGGTSSGGPVYFYVSSPLLTEVSPNAGPPAGGNSVTLTGVHLIEATAVRFGSASAASFTVVSDIQVTVVAPAGIAGTVPITVTTAGGTSNGVPYSYLAAPSVTALSPAQGPLSGGNIVTFTGAGLAAVTAVWFAVQSAAFTIVSDIHLTAIVPAGSAGPVDVTVVAPGGGSPPVVYTRVPAPVI